MRPLNRRSLAWLAPFIPLTLASRCDDVPGCGAVPPEMERSLVEGTVFASETAITYSDGETRIGVLFKDEHRQAVSWDQIPAPWMVAIVAAEDGRFWKHSGVDATSVARAARDNLEAGGVVSGGSTLTQQTAKNLFDRPDRSLDSKLSELDQALHLEKIYTKREILTYYANLFHVTGNGSGLAIAARYFFDKKASDLTVLESAYLAGLVKGPANYDPFPGDAAKQASNKERAHERTRYVLERMVAEELDNLIPAEGDGKAVTKADVEKIRAEAKTLLDKGFEIPFKQGVFRYDSSMLLDEIERRLNEPAFTELLADSGVTDLYKAGLTVVTTLDKDIQHEATYGLWHHMSDLGIMLEAKPATVFVASEDSAPDEDSKPPVRHEFRYAKVLRHVDDGGKHLEADLGGGKLCNIDRDAIVRAAGTIHKGKLSDRYAKVPTADVDAFVDGIADGAVVWVSVRETGSEATLCDLEARPELQGAVVVVEDGQLRAMVGGTTGKDFNRATAPRQMGSTFKPLVYHAAMTLGWQPEDVLDNRRGVFPFSGTYYQPSPDHEPKDFVSMSWAGVNSENLASIWLLYHLTDPLAHDDVHRIAKTVGLAREEGEDDDAYKKRMEGLGILSTAGRVPEGHFFAAKREVSAMLVAEGEMEAARELQSMHYGWGFESARKKASDKDAFDSNWLAMASLVSTCGSQYDALQRGIEGNGAISGVSSLSLKLEDDEIKVACGDRPDGYSTPSTVLAGRDVDAADPGPAPKPKPTPEPEGKAGKGKAGKGKAGGKSPAKAKAPPEPATVKPSRGGGGLQLASKDDMIVGKIPYGALAALQSAMERQKLVYDTAKPGLYDPEVLYKHADFRLLLGMRYVTHLAKTYGVKTDLLEVMSLPLGASEITLEEAASIYEGITSGERFADAVSTGTTLTISEIRDREGKVLYKSEPKATQVVAASNGEMTADILRNVIMYGTGKSAQGIAQAGAASVPLGGKTGTTNDFKNVAFVGFLPGQAKGGYLASAGYTVAVYVGYDDNRPMKVGKISIAGSSGALPTWMLTVQGILAHHPQSAPTGMTASGGYWPLAHGADVVARAVSSSDGLPEDGGSATLLTRLKRAPVEGPVVATIPERKRPTKARKKPWWSLW